MTYLIYLQIYRGSMQYRRSGYNGSRKYLLTSLNQCLAQLSISWLLAKKQMTSVLIGASKDSQIDDCIHVVQFIKFTKEEL